MHSAKIHIQLLIQQLKYNGVTHFVVSPGSRNAPIIIELEADPELNKVVVVDERSAGFVALGMASELKTPVALVCTSGTATLNYSSALAEAFYQGIPLIAITADRPKKWINQGEGQSINQNEVFTNFSKGFLDFDGNRTLSELKIALQETILKCKSGFEGPIHINCPLTEPLYEVDSKSTFDFSFSDTKSHADLGFDDLKNDFNQTDKVLILCTQMNPSASFKRSLSLLAENYNVAILCENTSGLSDAKFNHCIDRLITSISKEEMDVFTPDLLITIGENIISKKIKQFLRSNKPNNHYHISKKEYAPNTFECLTANIKADASIVIDALSKIEVIGDNNFGNKWKQRDFETQSVFENQLSAVPFSDVKAFEIVLDSIPNNSILHMGNSSVVRYCQLFNPVSDIQYKGNRGVSGIDGSTSTALGSSFISKNKINTLISGDTSFFYDSNAMWNDFPKENLRIIVINNNGGSIFKIINGPSSVNNFEKYFITPSERSVSNYCKSFNMEFLYASSIDQLESSLFSLYTKDFPAGVVLEINTSEVENEDYFKGIMKAIAGEGLKF